jgi:hypothetical protein
MKRITSSIIAAAFAASFGSAFAAAPGPISGTYSVKYERTCVRSPIRPAATPAFFDFSTPDGTSYGFLNAPAGMTHAQATAVTSRTAETGTYIMVVNPITNTITTSGNYHNIPLVAHATNPVAFADFGTFTGFGTFTQTPGNPSIDITSEVMAVVGDGVSQSRTTNMKYRFETRDRGDNIYSVTGRGSVRLQHNITANWFRDVYCTSMSVGTKISRDY